MEVIICDKIKFIYNRCSSLEINEVILYFKNNYERIMNFFGKADLDVPVVIRIWDDHKTFREQVSYLSGIEDIPEWSIGMANSRQDNKINRIDCLSLEQIRKIPYHKDKNVDDLKNLVIHEFAHICHDEYTDYNENIPYWVQEGIAVYLSNQYENAKLTVSLDEIKKDNIVSYNNYRYIFDKIVSNCSREQILELLKGDNTDKFIDYLS